jgi:hypothetical protein
MASAIDIVYKYSPIASSLHRSLNFIFTEDFVRGTVDAKTLRAIFDVQLPQNTKDDADLAECAVKASDLSHDKFITWFETDTRIQDWSHPAKAVIKRITTDKAIWSHPVPENMGTYQVSYVNPVILALFSQNSLVFGKL